MNSKFTVDQWDQPSIIEFDSEPKFREPNRPNKPNSKSKPRVSEIVPSSRAENDIASAGKARKSGDEGGGDSQLSKISTNTLAGLVKVYAAERFGPVKSEGSIGRGGMRPRSRAEVVFTRKVAALDGARSCSKVRHPSIRIFILYNLFMSLFCPCHQNCTFHTLHAARIPPHLTGGVPAGR